MRECYICGRRTAAGIAERLLCGTCMRRFAPSHLAPAPPVLTAPPARAWGPSDDATQPTRLTCAYCLHPRAASELVDEVGERTVRVCRDERKCHTCGPNCHTTANAVVHLEPCRYLGPMDIP